jgi:hypothetical protein
MERIEKSTVFVLGAGASVPYGYPTGGQLVDWIINSPLQANTTLNCQDYWNFKAALAKSPDESVDAFLESQPNLEPIGKRAIAEWLINCEMAEKLKRRAESDDWVRALFRAQLKGRAFEHIPGLPFCFVTFNYDRSLEAVIFDCLSGKFGRSDQDTGGMCMTIPIFHVHGCLDPLHWDTRWGIPTRAYGPAITSDNVQRAADQIKIIHNPVANTPDFTRARERLSTAERVYFLGFGYHLDNLRRLHNGTTWRLGVRLSGTAFRLKAAQRHTVEDRLRAVGSGFPALDLRASDYSIVDFLDNITDL